MSLSIRRALPALRNPLPTASTSSSSHFASSSLRPFSTTPPTHESKARRKSRLTRKSHIESKASLARAHAVEQPDPVLGYGRGRDALWDESLLKSVLLDRDEVWGTTVSVVPGETAGGRTAEGGEAGEQKTLEAGKYVPSHFNFGLSREQALEMVDVLPKVSAMRAALGTGPDLFDDVVAARAEAARKVEQDKMGMLVKIMDLRNAGSKGIEVENTRRIVAAFGRKEGDTGSPEVQAAIMTSRIHSLTAHLTTQPRDVQNRRPLRSLIQQRVKVLKYLRSLDVKRYEDCLGKIGVEARAVEGEVIVTKLGLRSLIRGA